MCPSRCSRLVGGARVVQVQNETRAYLDMPGTFDYAGLDGIDIQHTRAMSESAPPVASPPLARPTGQSD